MKRGLICLAFILVFVVLIGIVSSECTDSDGGINPNVSGHLSGGGLESYDSCLVRSDDGIIQKFAIESCPLNDISMCYVVEKYCDNGGFNLTNIRCPNGCLSGRCLAAGETMLCTDTDGGKNYYQEGTVTVGSLSKTDWCIDPKWLNEYFCNQNEQIANENFECEYGCNSLKGACFNEAQTSCKENWSCGTWSECMHGNQIRVCLEKNNCGTITNEPETSRTCSFTICVEDWECGNWNSCINDKQIRTCTDKNSCRTSDSKPITTKDCCIESWSCNAWSNCIKNIQARTCKDSNNCGTTVNKPNESNECSVYINSKKVILDKNGDSNIIKSEEKTASTSLNVTTDSEKVFIKTSSGNKEIMITPDEAISKIKKIDNISDMRIEENNDGTLSYKVTGTKRARLFFIFSIEADVIEMINAQTGEIISINKPWWHIFALGV